MMTSASALSVRQREEWDVGGFLHLRSAIPDAEIDAIIAAVDAQWRRPEGNDHAVDVLTGSHGGRVYTIEEAPPSIRNDAYKLNNLFGRVPEVRRVALLPMIKPILDELIGGDAMICNSLNFERGSQQPFHIDSWYMPGPTEDSLIAASFALDDVDSDNGPISYYPGSHLIPAFRFSNGRLNEGADCQAYLAAEIATRGLQSVELHAERGDIFIWHGQLLHGGRPIRDMARKRRSLVVHYWRRQDLPRDQVREDRHGSYLGHTLRGEISF